MVLSSWIDITERRRDSYTSTKNMSACYCSSVNLVLLLAFGSRNFPLAQLVEHECIVSDVPGSRPAWGKICPGYITFVPNRHTEGVQ